jgi:hypothetical protein
MGDVRVVVVVVVAVVVVSNPIHYTAGAHTHTQTTHRIKRGRD